MFPVGVDRYAAKHFRWMHLRVKRKQGRVCKFPRTTEGYLLFIKEMGPIPEGMKQPSVGRIKHDKGYEPGNVQWEEYTFNRWKQRRDEVDLGGVMIDDNPPF